jgi:haloacetate dehalogenase
MFAGFESGLYTVNGTQVFALHNKKTGAGKPPLLLLHGYPQSHLIWHKVVPLLEKKFILIISDLRGYGNSDKPVGLPDHSNYSKKVMAADQVQLMQQLGFDHFFVAGHDRGGRVAHRLCVDYPEKVWKLCLLDISPTLTMYEQTNMEFAKKYWWWFFLIQPAPLPEQLITAAPEAYLKQKIGYGLTGLSPFTNHAYQAYLSYVSDYNTNHGMCEDYRAAAGIDLEHDRQDRRSGKKIECPLQVLWGELGVVNKCFQPLRDWREKVNDQYPVIGGTTPSGHYLPEEVPQIVAERFIDFFTIP